MGVDSGSGCKDVHKFPHNIITFPTPLVSAVFVSIIPTICSLLKMFFVFSFL